MLGVVRNFSLLLVLSVLLLHCPQVHPPSIVSSLKQLLMHSARLSFFSRKPFWVNGSERSYTKSSLVLSTWQLGHTIEDWIWPWKNSSMKLSIFEAAHSSLSLSIKNRSSSELSCISQILKFFYSTRCSSLGVTTAHCGPLRARFNRLWQAERKGMLSARPVSESTVQFNQGIPIRHWRTLLRQQKKMSFWRPTTGNMREGILEMWRNAAWAAGGGATLEFLISAWRPAS